MLGPSYTQIVGEARVDSLPHLHSQPGGRRGIIQFKVTDQKKININKERKEKERTWLLLGVVEEVDCGWIYGST